MLKFLPSDKAKDARNFVNSLQYWLGGNQENLENLLINVAQVCAWQRQRNIRSGYIRYIFIYLLFFLSQLLTFSCLSLSPQEYVPAMKGLSDATVVSEPVLPPDVGIWHPCAPIMYEDLKEYLNW